MAQDYCPDKLFLSCPKQHVKSQTSCGCLLSDFMPLVEKCNLNIRIICKIEIIRDTSPIPKCKVIRFLKNMWDKICAFFFLSIDTQNRWKQWIVIKTLEGIIWWHYHRYTIAFAVLLILSLFLLCKSMLVLFLSALVSLIAYIPIMQVKKDMELYYIVESQHYRESYQSENSVNNSSSTTVISELPKYSILLASLNGSIPKTDCSYLNEYEKVCFDNIINRVNEPEGEIKIIEVLVKNPQCSEYELYEK